MKNSITELRKLVKCLFAKKNPQSSVNNHPGGENTGDNVQETHGQSPPSHPTLISADLRVSGFHG
ncbi:MAG: hypothetical protein WC340_16825, partial [Kiritimatiellia bacterium]